MTAFLSRGWRGYRLLVRFIRLPMFCFAGVLPLLGAASASPGPSVGQILLLLGLALSCQVFASLLNDVVDLPIDRTQSWRQEDLLVRGAIRPELALGIALIQIPVGMTLTFLLHASIGAYLALGCAYVSLTIYNLWGKRCPLPPVTDCALGVGCGMLIVYAAAALPFGLSRETAVGFAFITLFTILANGIHGSLLDLANDFDHHARTTALLLGARPDGWGITVSSRVMLYGLAFQMALAGITVLPLTVGWVRYSSVALFVALILQVPAFGFWPLLPQVTHPHARLALCAHAHILIMLCTLMALYFPHLDPNLRRAFVAVFVIPLLMSRKYPENPFVGPTRHSSR